ncbi:MAG TPA: hypothetical protein PLP64_08485 [Pseudothermotoga sp.]|nr:hypothetical protein [Pseudothermotoga sp.]HOK84245.1 hypothetical protein [Pseudothermotoga sp.]HPP71054.1 hypothetical protein [Pseudothermotoga sp.]
MIIYVYIAMLIYFVVILMKTILKKPDSWNWLMGAMVIAPWILRILLIK